MLWWSWRVTGVENATSKLILSAAWASVSAPSSEATRNALIPRREIAPSSKNISSPQNRLATPSTWTERFIPPNKNKLTRVLYFRNSLPFLEIVRVGRRRQPAPAPKYRALHVASYHERPTTLHYYPYPKTRQDSERRDCFFNFFLPSTTRCAGAQEL